MLMWAMSVQITAPAGRHMLARAITLAPLPPQTKNTSTGRSNNSWNWSTARRVYSSSP